MTDNETILKAQHVARLAAHVDRQQRACNATVYTSIVVPTPRPPALSRSGPDNLSSPILSLLCHPSRFCSHSLSLLVLDSSSLSRNTPSRLSGGGRPGRCYQAPFRQGPPRPAVRGSIPERRLGAVPPLHPSLPPETATRHPPSPAARAS